MRRILLTGSLILSLASIIFADIAQPDKPKKQSKIIDTSLSIRLDSEASEARLIIPRAQVQQLRAELERLDDGTENTAAVEKFTTVRTIVSGSLLSLAFVFGGLWFVSGASQKSKAVAAAAIVLSIGSIATLVYGNAGPPPEARSITGKMFTQGVHMYKGGWGAIKLEVSNTATTPMLIVPDKPKPADE